MRSFVAIDLSAEAGRALQALLESVRSMAPHARWVRPEQAHLTLSFLGDVAEGEAGSLARALDDAVKAFAPFTLDLGGAGTFGPPSHPKVLWLGLAEGAEALSALQRAVQAALEQVLPAWREARDFTAHLTLARAKGQRGDRALAACREQLRHFSLGASPVEAVRLYKSQLSANGATHEVLHVARLGG